MLRQPPSIVAGKYEVLGRLGEGGQGSVWKVRHIDLDQVRALKWHPDEAFEGAENVQRFRREGLALAKLRHPHIVQVFDLGRDDQESAYYLVMEYVEGQNLAQRLKTRGRPTLPDALEIARQMASALAYAHRQPYVDSAGRSHQGMIHRDIKPSNVLIRDQVQAFSLLADFGLVKLGDAGERTTTGAIMGTYKYSAPEQLGLRRGREAVPHDFRADMFAFGLVLFELLEGRQFHHGLDMSQVYGRALLEDLEPEFTEPVTPRLHGLVARCIRRFPEDRPESMAWVLREIEEITRDLGGDETQTWRVQPEQQEPHTDEDLDRRIRALLEERERRRLQPIQAAARQARTRAQAVQAPALVGQVFEQAVRAEEDASVAFKEGRFEDAARLYDECTRAFGEAETAAAAARARQAVADGQTALAEARRRAGEQDAQALAPEESARARALDDRARAAVEGGTPEEAASALRDAAAQYEAAATAARRTRQRRETAAARERCGTAHAAAEAAQAARLAAEPFDDGCKLESSAEAALGDEDFEAALQLYGRATAEFEAAGVAATRERGLRAAADARAKAEQARQASERAEAPTQARDVYDRACAALAAGAKALAAEKFDDAAAAYDRAREEFARATAEAEAARARAREAARQRATRARSQAEAADAAALAAGAAEHARPALAEANAQLTEARRLQSRGDDDAAAALFERAAEALERVRVASEAARTDIAARAVAEARQVARRAGAAELAADQFAAAERLAAEGQAAATAGRHADARRAFEEAVTLHRRAAEEAAREQRRIAASREQMAAARTRALAAREAAVKAQAERWAPEPAAAAARWHAGADDAAAANDLERGAEGYAQAATAFAQAAKEAKQARADAEAKEEAERVARRKEEEARQAAARASEEERRRAEEAQRRAEAEAHRLEAERQRAEEAARQRAQEAERRRAEEAEQQRAQAAERRRAEEAERRRTEEAERRHAEEEARRQRAEDEARRRRADEEARSRRAEEAARARAAEPPQQDAGADATVVRDERTIVGDDRTILRDDRTVTTLAESVAPQPEPAVSTPARARRPSPAEWVPVRPVEEAARPVPGKPSWPSPPLAAGAAAIGLVLLVVVYLALRPSPSSDTADSTPRPAPATPAALEWAETSPGSAEAVVREGEALTFSARLAASGQSNASYTWYLDGARQATGPSWRYAPDHLSGGATREVKVVASAASQSVEHRWDVIVQNVNRAPTISKPREAKTRVDVPQGGTAELHVDATDPDEGDVLTYTWDRDGARIAGASGAGVSIRDAKDGEEVRVTVRDREGAAADTRVFALAVPTAPSSPPTTPPAVDAPPRLLGQSPPAGRVRITEGAEQRFDVRAIDPESGELTYTWLLNGKKVGAEPRWVLADASGLTEPATLEARVSDAGGHVASARWTLERVEPRPEIVEWEPRPAEVNVAAGESLRLSARATSARPGARVRYDWLLDGAAVPGATGGEVELPRSLAPGRHALEVAAVDDRGVRGEVHRWTIRIATPPAEAGITEAEVRGWLARYRTAFESNDRDALVQLGIAASTDEADKMVRSWGRRTVTLSDEQIERGASGAVVSFSRKDRDVDAGRDLQYPQRLRYQLEKGPSGLRAVRR